MFPIGRLPTLLAAVALTLLALWILWLGPNRSLHRAFALFLVLRALIAGVLTFEDGVATPAGWFVNYLFIAIPFAALHFAYVFRQQHGPRRPWLQRPYRGIIRISILILALLFELIYFLDHDQWIHEPSSGPITLGWMSLFLGLIYTTFAFIACIIAASARYAKPEQRRSLLLLAGAFALEPAYRGTVSILNRIVQGTPDGLAVGGLALDLLTMALVAGFVVFLVLRGIGGASGSLLTTRILVLLGLSLGSGVAVHLLFRYVAVVGFDIVLPTVWALDALWLLMLAAIAGYATIMHRLFDIDLKAKRFVRSGSMAAVLGFLLVVIGESLEQVLDVSNGAFAIIVALLITILLRPVQRVAKRIGDAAFPGVERNDTYLERRRRQVFSAALEGVYHDGEISPKERGVLEALRREIGLDAAEAAELEQQVIAATAALSRGRSGTSAPASARGLPKPP